ncbi:hypothetical protein CTAYLR_005775 [Chrysophaeum taylorii]|uniref:SET domain-containing protein n=1 Tax=Chrysophaeum taylorii TaxID=2483200 RepID=A0AAD7XRM3_9STRA|nr:hypothetical protein CTAYLR_005775 [Chrysophaeum taylorii]
MGYYRFKRVEAYDGGIGAFATRPIPRGELVLREEPIVTGRSVEEVEVAVGALGPTERKKFYSLLGKTALEIFETNGYPCGERAGVMFELSRFNHSCRPNCGHHWEGGFQFLYAIRDVARGEELTTNYVPLAQPRAARRAGLPFECRCAACEPLDAASDARRIRISDLDGEIFAAARSRKSEKAAALATERLALLEEEGIDEPRAMVRTCNDAYQAMVSDDDRARVWLKKLYKFSLLCEPPDSPVLRDLEAKLKTLLTS